MPAVEQNIFQFFFKFRSESFTLDNEQNFLILTDANIGTTGFLSVTELKRFFDFNIAWLIIFLQKSVDALKDDEIFILRKIFDGITMDFQIFWIEKFFFIEVNRHTKIILIKIFRDFFKIHSVECGFKIFFSKQKNPSFVERL